MHSILYFLRSLTKFVRASSLSLIIIVILFVLMTMMGQGLTMVVALMEQEPLSLLITLAYVNLLALMLSHYPIYTYMASDINRSADYFQWRRYNMFGRIQRWIPIYNFEEIDPQNTKYKKDYFVHFFRYALGFLVYTVWAQILINSYDANLRFNEQNLSTIMWITHLSSLIPISVYIYFYKKIDNLEDGPKKGKILKNLALVYLGFAITGFTLIALLMIFDRFSMFGLYLLLILNFVMLFNFVFFRLLRKHFGTTLNYISEHKNRLAHLCLRTIKPLSRSVNYLRLFMYGFLLSLVFVIICIYQSLVGADLVNGLPILMAYLYCYSYLIATLAKFFLVCRANSPNPVRSEGANSPAYKVAFWGICVLAIMFTIRFFTPVKTHELDQVCAVDTLTDEQYTDALMERGDTLFFIASHGGGLKASVWTLNVMHALDTITDGEMLRQSAAMSGASGGSLGLALYTALSGECSEEEHDEILKRINRISKGNHTSLDLTMLMGPDFYRKLFPFNMIGGNHDRAYHAMVRYQNYVQGYDEVKNNELSKESFRSFWQKVYHSRDRLFPALIMNTSARHGQRGIVWSLQSEHFHDVFPNSQNLGDLQGGKKTLSFYQGVSMTDRFPVFSPAAKISGYGHYVDAGIIDNSGLLGCYDYYLALSGHSTHREAMQKKTIVFVEIVNSKSIYIQQLIEEFELKDQATLKIDEKESPSIITDLNTVANVDKIPGYMSDLMKLQSQKKSDFQYVQILLPHRVSIEDVEGFLSGKIKKSGSRDVRCELTNFLNMHNDTINKRIKNKTGFFTSWKCLEPELSRHFSTSNVNYVKAILQHPRVLKQIQRIKELAPVNKRK